MKTTYFKIDRSLFKHWLWEDKPFSRGQAWIDLIGLAYHKDLKTMVDGELIDVKRGEVRTSLSFLARRWGWSRDKVRHFLDILQNEGMINRCPTGKSTARTTPIFIENYNTYQCDYTALPTGKPTSDRQATDRNKNVKECIDKVVVDAHTRVGNLSDRLSNDEWERLDRQFQEFLPLIDRIDDQVAHPELIESPYSYILSAANRMGWPRKY